MKLKILQHAFLLSSLAWGLEACHSSEDTSSQIVSEPVPDNGVPNNSTDDTTTENTIIDDTVTDDTVTDDTIVDDTVTDDTVTDDTLTDDTVTDNTTGDDTLTDDTSTDDTVADDTLTDDTATDDTVTPNPEDSTSDDDDDDDDLEPRTLSVLLSTPQSLSPCETGSLSAEVENAVGNVIYTWNLGDGETYQEALLQKRFIRPGTQHVSLSVMDEEGNVGEAEADILVNALDQDRTLIFSIHASSPDEFNFIRSVSIDARDIGIPNWVGLFDDGIGGHDATAGDGIFTGYTHAASCPGMDDYWEQMLTVTVQDATGESRTQQVRASQFLSESE